MLPQNTQEEQLTAFPEQVEAKFMGSRIGSQKFKDTSKMKMMKKEYMAMNNLEARTSHLQSKITCLCSKFGKSARCEKCRDILPPVSTNVNNYYKKSDPQRVPSISNSNAYHHSQKHVSEKFQ